MKALVVGYGSIGKRHVQNLLSIPNVEIIICTKRKNLGLVPKRCKVFDSLEKCLEEKPNVGFIANVTSLHVLTAIRLAESGVDLFIEKPLSNSVKGIKTLSNMVRRKRLVTQIGCNLRFHSCIKEIKEIIDRNEIGRIISAHVESGSYLPEWHKNEDYRESYAASKDLGGGVVLTCIHEIDYLYWFFGNVKEVFSITGKFSELELDVEDLSSTIIRFANNIIAEVHLDYFQRPDFRSCKIIGTRGTIHWDSETNMVKVFDIKKRKWIKKIQLHNYNRNDMYNDEIRHFLKCVKDRKMTLNDINQGIKTLEIALAILKSGKINRVVRL